MAKRCELCASEAKMYCESDRASLCWDCDARVHGANFLVAKHSRTLLCRLCQSLTPWTASGPRLGPTVSVCRDCLGGCCRNRTGDEEEEEVQPQRRRQQQQQEGGGDRYDHRDGDGIEDDDDDDDSDYDDDNDDDDDDDCVEEDEDEENQVVPWSKPAQPLSSSSRSDHQYSKSNSRETSPSASDSTFSWTSRFS